MTLSGAPPTGYELPFVTVDNPDPHQAPSRRSSWIRGALSSLDEASAPTLGYHHALDGYVWIRHHGNSTRNHPSRLDPTLLLDFNQVPTRPIRRVLSTSPDLGRAVAGTPSNGALSRSTGAETPETRRRVPGLSQPQYENPESRQLGPSPPMIPPVKSPESDVQFITDPASLRRGCKQLLLKEAKKWPSAPAELYLKKYLCYNDDDQTNALKTPTFKQVAREWQRYELLARNGVLRRTEPFQVYGTVVLYELDRLKCWVGLNMHRLAEGRKPWPPGYTPCAEHWDLDPGSDVASVYTKASTDLELSDWRLWQSLL